MYQEIDEGEDAAQDSGNAQLPWLWVAIGAALLALILVVVLLMPSEPSNTPSFAGDEPTARTAYLAALSEPSPALRRARLADFAQTYPDDSRTSAVAAQLSVLEAREASDWAQVTDVLYTREASRLDRIAAIDAFESKWGADLLGGRADEIAKLRGELEASVEDPAPSRALEDEASPIPSSIQGSSMAGAPMEGSSPLLILPPDTGAETLRLPPSEVVETPPELRRAPTPTYPRSARRRGIGAIVELEMDIDTKGRVDQVRILRVEAERYGKDFARAAKRAAERSRFRPRRLDGEAVPTIGYKKRYRFEP